MAFSAANADPPTLFKIAQCGKNEAYLLTWALVLIIADWAHTLPLEVELMWPAPLSMIKVLFFLNRYNVLDILLSFVHTLGASVPTQCKVVFYIASIWLVVSIGFAEAIMYMRVYALSGRSKIVLIILSTQFVLIHGGSVVILAVFLAPMKYEISPLPNLLPCLPVITDDDILISIFFAIVMLSELLIFIYTMWIGYRKHRESSASSGLLKVFYRDGVFYFGALFVASAANLIILFTVLPTCRYMFNIPQRALHSILAGRTVLHLKAQSSQRVIEYSSHGRAGNFLASNANSSKSNLGRHQESFALTDLRAASTFGRTTDPRGDVSAVTTGPFEVDDDDLHGSDTKPVDLLRGFGDVESLHSSPPKKIEPLRRQRTKEGDDASNETWRAGTQTRSPSRGGLQILVQRQQTLSHS